jgi:hypothetical protein
VRERAGVIGPVPPSSLFAWPGRVQPTTVREQNASYCIQREPAAINRLRRDTFLGSLGRKGFQVLE